jgi:3-oxoacyl-(acyl-carrier-protein) synthase
MMTNPGPRVVITGVGAVSPAGVGAGPLLEALLARRDLISELQEPWAVRPYELGARVAAFNAKDRIPARRLRRLGRISQMAVIAALEAQEQAGLAGASAAGVVIGTGLGALGESMELLGQIQDGDPSAANPSLFPATVMNVAAAHVSMELGLTGYNTTINHKEISTEMALQVAADAIQSGHVEIVMAGGVDELSMPVHHGYRRLGALAHGRPRPYRMGRDGMILGEGACVFVLEERDQALRRGARVIAEVAGTGAASGQRPLTSYTGREAERSSIEAGVRALRSALREAGRDPQEIDLIVGCGCGSPALDRLEARVLAEVFGDRPVPVTSPHGGLGTWMAAGGLRVTAAAGALIAGRLFPTVTAGEPDPDVPLPGLVTEARDAVLRSVLVSSHASGGGSAALVLTRLEP